MKRNILGPSIRDIRKENHLTQKQLSELTGFKQNTISQHESQKRELSENDLIKYAKALNINVGQFYDRLNNGLSDSDNIVNDESSKVFKDITQVPVIGDIACGDPITALQNIEEYMPAPSSSLPVGNNFYLRCDGESMKPTINNGSLVLIHEQPTVEDGEIAAVLIDGEATLKRVKHQGKTVILIPDNNQFNPIVLTDDIDARILGKALQVVNSL